MAEHCTCGPRSLSFDPQCPRHGSMCRPVQRITEVPSTDADETVSAMYRALSRGHEREAQALARYYLHAKHERERNAGVSLVDGESSCAQTPIPSPMDSEREG